MRKVVKGVSGVSDGVHLESPRAAQRAETPAERGFQLLHAALVHRAEQHEGLHRPLEETLETPVNVLG